MRHRKEWMQKVVKKERDIVNTVYTYCSNWNNRLRHMAGIQRHHSMYILQYFLIRSSYAEHNVPPISRWERNNKKKTRHWSELWTCLITWLLNTLHMTIYIMYGCAVFFSLFFRSFPSTREHELAVWILRGAFSCLNTLSIRGDFHGR